MFGLTTALSLRKEEVVRKSRKVEVEGEDYCGICNLWIAPREKRESNGEVVYHKHCIELYRKRLLNGGAGTERVAGLSHDQLNLS